MKEKRSGVPALRVVMIRQQGRDIGVTKTSEDGAVECITSTKPKIK
jgi:hypothetical protein